MVRGGKGIRMATKILARDDQALKNGSFLHVRTYKTKASVVTHYILGDFHGYVVVIPSGLREYTTAEARRVLKSR